MHEVAPITAAATALAEATSAATIASITIAIAPDVDPDVAAVTWQAAVDQTPLTSAELTWERAHHTLACLDCGTDYPGGELDPCPHCGGNGLVVMRAPICTVVDWTEAADAPSATE